jgi:hypothetical protein
VADISIADPAANLSRARADLRVLRRDLIGLIAHRTLWRQTNDAIAERASDAPALWPNHYAWLYAEAQQIAVRRLVRGRSGQVSLSGVLQTLERRPDCVSLATIRAIAEVQEVDEVLALRAVEAFQDEWATPDGILDRAIPCRDRAALLQRTSRVLEWVDRNVAHAYDPSDVTVTPPLFSDLDAAIDAAVGVFQRYWQLLNGVCVAVDLTMLAPDWVRTFDRPLFSRPVEWSPDGIER